MHCVNFLNALINALGLSRGKVGEKLRRARDVWKAPPIEYRKLKQIETHFSTITDVIAITINLLACHLILFVYSNDETATTV